MGNEGLTVKIRRWLAGVLLLSVLVSMSSVANCDAGVTIVAANIKSETLDLKYPQLNGLRFVVIEKAINHNISEAINSFRKEADGQPDMKLWSSYKVLLNRNDLVSILMAKMSYVKRAAHPNTIETGFNFDIKTGKILRLEDLFRAENAWEDRLDAIMRQKIKELEDNDRVRLFGPYKGVRAASPQEFYLTDDWLVLFYQRYEYTAYVFGRFDLAISWEEITDLLTPEMAGRILGICQSDE